MTARDTPAATSRRAATRAQRDEKHRRRQLEELAHVIRQHRIARKLSQKELADRAGTSHSAISRIESGRHGITVETLQRIAQALGVDLILTFESGGWRPVRRSVRLDKW
jgi:transcriptional regulator with XRE-family HTH domain